MVDNFEVNYYWCNFTRVNKKLSSSVQTKISFLIIINSIAQAISHLNINLQKRLCDNIVRTFDKHNFS